LLCSDVPPGIKNAITEPAAPASKVLLFMSAMIFSPFRMASAFWLIAGGLR
jgi:hypothetical protein